MSELQPVNTQANNKKGILSRPQNEIISILESKLTNGLKLNRNSIKQLRAAYNSNEQVMNLLDRMQNLNLASIPNKLNIKQYNKTFDKERPSYNSRKSGKWRGVAHDLFRRNYEGAAYDRGEINMKVGNKVSFDQEIDKLTNKFDTGSKRWVRSVINPAHCQDEMPSGIPDGLNCLSSAIILKLDVSIQVEPTNTVVVCCVPDILTPLLIVNVPKDNPTGETIEAKAYKFAPVTKPTSFLSSSGIIQYRIMANSMTIRNNTAKMYVNGTTYSVKQQSDFPLSSDGNRYYSYPNTSDSITANPKSATNKASEGVYLINNNNEPVYTMMECDESPISFKIENAKAINGETYKTDVKYDDGSEAVVVSDSLKKGWSSGFTIIETTATSTFSVTVFMSAQLMLSSTSLYVPLVQPTPPMDYAALMFASNFFNYNVTIYPAAYNDWNKIWSAIKNGLTKLKPLVKPAVGLLSDVIPEIKPFATSLLKVM